MTQDEQHNEERNSIEDKISFEHLINPDKEELENLINSHGEELVKKVVKEMSKENASLHIPENHTKIVMPPSLLHNSGRYDDTVILKNDVKTEMTVLDLSKFQGDGNKAYYVEQATRCSGLVIFIEKEKFSSYNAELIYMDKSKEERQLQVIDEYEFELENSLSNRSPSSTAEIIEEE